MSAHGEAIGVLHVETDSPDLSELEALARMIALALGNILAHLALKEQSIRDPLTGLANRRYLTEQLETEVARARRQGSTIGILMLDADHFKTFNDNHGHVVGDQVLISLSRSLVSQSRTGDVVSRYGGEEFVVVMPGAALPAAVRRAEALQSRIRSLAVSHAGKDLSVTVSIGVAVFPDHGQTAAEVLDAADQALYRAKEAGRDRVEAAA
jgi:diguanylate cyclase (GGDEF)-like protein